ncbi:MAG: endonuclease MutS2, partial [Firmicutes bacterium]|nr:endonuclease MutS2 [Bacillota bacterium]
MQKKIDRVIRQLEFDKVRGKLVRYTCSPWGAERALSLLPFKTYDEVERAQKETSEACAILRESSSPMSVVKEIRQILGRAEKGGFLQGEELRLIGDFLYALQKLKRSFQKDFFQKKAPLLSALALEIDLLPHLYQAIERAIDKDGSVLDKASPKLFSLRRKKINLQERIQERMERYLKDPSLKKVLQELLITIRNNRYVLPLKQEYRQALPGIVHDQSASGATLFVEPLPVVELHNELQQAKKEEEIEIERILRELSSAVAAETESLIRSVELYGYLDFTFSKGHYSLEIDAIEPRLNKDRTLKIVQGRHPLLGARAVPVDFHIGDSFQTLVITGPNTGGKTVTLKTVGLFVLMAQSGMHLPAAIGTEMPLYNGVYVDIGDEQNIEQSLSTFSGHLNNIIEILKYAGSKSLVLLDELGAGTDPQEGA